MFKNRSILYVNYAPYENSGRILDFLRDNFELVFLFSIGFYSLTNDQQARTSNYIHVYRGRTLERAIILFEIPGPSWLAFYLLPIRSAIHFCQLLFHALLLRVRFGKIDVSLNVNAFTAWIGLLLKAIGLVRKTVFWVYDYYPPTSDRAIVTITRKIYWQFDKMGPYSDRLVFVNRRMMDVWKTRGLIPHHRDYPIVTIGTDPVAHGDKKPSFVFGFLGVVKKSQGLDLMFDNARVLLEHFPGAQLEVVGSGPDEDYFKQRAKESPLPTTFHGYLEGDSFDRVLEQCAIGFATYVPHASNVSYYGDPGKIKRYLSLGLPVIATNVFGDFSKEIIRFRAGEIVGYDDPTELIEAIKRILNDYSNYSNNAITLSQQYYYKDIYPDLFRGIFPP